MTLYTEADARRALSVDYDRLNALEDELGDAFENDPETELGLPPGETHGFDAWRDRILMDANHPLYAKAKEHWKLREDSLGCVSLEEAKELAEDANQ